MIWKRNLVVLWFGQFMALSGMTMIVPFLPLYIQQLGITNPDKVALWAGVIFAGNFVTAFLFQPFWGRLADRYGRKVMILRSGFGMAVVMTLMGFSSSVWHLLLLRMVNGTVSGFIPAATALVSANTPKEHMGFAMGVMQSGAVAGTILGPVIGGLLAETIGYRPIFYITGSLLFLATILAWIVVKERFDRKEASSKPYTSILQGYKDLRSIQQLPALFFVTFMIQFAMLSTLPQMPLYIQQLHGLEMAAFFAGLVGAVTGTSNMIASPLFGRIADRIGGSERILLWSLIGSILVYVPQAFVTNVWQLLALRFLQGICMAGLLPSVNALVRKYTPDGMESRAFSFNTSYLSLGNMAGPVAGGLLAPFIGIQGIFIIGSIMLGFNAWWVRRTLFGLRNKANP
jgi:DHA1 family multidrug resistance protein-like MFS transporter